MSTVSIKLLIISLCFTTYTISAKNYINLNEYSNETKQFNYINSDPISSLFKSLASEFIDDYSKVVCADNFWNTARTLLKTIDNDSVSIEQIETFENSNNSVINAIVSPYVEHIPVIYESTGTDGEKINLSGAIFIPKASQIKKLVLILHPTIGADREAPSQTYCLESIFALTDAVVIMPDYIGFGTTNSYIHPYLCSRLTAKNAIDLLLTTIPYLKYRGLNTCNNLVSIIGYSQGGAAAVAVQQMIESSDKIDITIEETFAGAGPYDPAATYDFCISNDKTNIPCAIPMLIQGMNISEHLNLPYESLFKNTLFNNYNNWINSKQYSILAINNLMQTTKISDIITPLAMNKYKPPTNLLYKALYLNSVVDYTPKSHLYLFHSTDDDMVPFINSEILKKSLQHKDANNVKYDFASYGGHIEAALIFYQKVFNMLK